MSATGVDAPPGFPYVSATAEIGGHTMAYLDEGPRDGPVVLMVHGNPTWSFHFRVLVRDLVARGHRVVAPDHIGMGRSARPARGEYPHTLARRVADLGSLVDHLDLADPLSLVVHDWGGPIGLSWAADHPERIDRLVLLNTAAFPLPTDHGLPWMLRLARLPVVGDLLVRGLGAFSVGALVLGTGQSWLGPEARRGLLAPYRRPRDRVAVHAFVQDIPVEPDDPGQAVLERLAAGLPRLGERPVQIHWGLRDPVFDADILAHLVCRLPDADVHRYESAGHYVLEDVPDAIVGRVGPFLAIAGGTP